jgi:hypothetical protein
LEGSENVRSSRAPIYLLLRDQAGKVKAELDVHVMLNNLSAHRTWFGTVGFDTYSFPYHEGVFAPFAGSGRAAA